MTDDETLIKKRFTELAERAASGHYYTYSDFLTISQQDVLCRTTLASQFTLNGGYPAAERRIACFGNEEMFGYAEEPPIVCICIAPVSQKFADSLSHRDFLGALLALGIKRDILGDIIIHENKGFLFCTDTISEFITEELKQVKKTTVECSIVPEPPEQTTALPELSEFVVASERLDAIVASVFKISRSESQKLFEHGKIFVNSKVTENTLYSPKNGDIISVRDYGRFIYEGIQCETRKGRIRVTVRIFR